MPAPSTSDVVAELWAKLLVNCAYNAISALAQASYAQLAALPAIREVQVADFVRQFVGEHLLQAQRVEVGGLGEFGQFTNRTMLAKVVANDSNHWAGVPFRPKTKSLPSVIRSVRTRDASLPRPRG